MGIAHLGSKVLDKIAGSRPAVLKLLVKRRVGKWVHGFNKVWVVFAGLTVEILLKQQYLVFASPGIWLQHCL